MLAINDNCSAGSPPQWSACIHLVKETDLASATPILNDRGSTGYTVPAPKNSFQDMPRYWFRDGGLVDGLFDASLAIDPYGNLFVSAAVSSPTRNPGMVVFGIRAPIDSVSWFTPVSPIVEGPSSYNCFNGGNNAWGAYMRAVPDPNNWTHAWMAGEVAVDSCWATAIVSATMGVGPQAAKMSPAFGSTKGGRMVQIDGSFFVPDADQVFFGSNPATIVAESPTAIIVTAPAGVAGSVAVTVQTPDGTASAGTFTYLTPGTVTAPPSSTGLHWR